MKIKLNLLIFSLALFMCSSNITASADAGAAKNAFEEIHTEKVLVNNHYMIYNHAGKGETIVLLHGIFGSKEQWRDFMEILSKKGYEVIAPDLPGYGKSVGYPLEDYDLVRQTKLLDEFLGKLHLRKIEIAGNSMGGAVAALYAKNHPEKISSLAFIGAPFGVKTPKKSIAYYLLDKGINPFIPVTEDDFNLEMKILFTNPIEMDENKVKSRVDRYKKEKSKDSAIWVMAENYGSIFNTNFLTKAPVLIVWGEKDNAIDISGAEIVHENTNSKELIIVPNGSHLLFIENPELIAEYYVKFLNKIH